VWKDRKRESRFFFALADLDNAGGADGMLSTPAIQIEIRLRDGLAHKSPPSHDLKGFMLVCFSVPHNFVMDQY
jgi:hypothetical protein